MKCLLAVKKDSKRLKEMEEVQRYFLEQLKPYKFDPYDQDSIIRESENSFEDICNTLEDQGFNRIKKLTEYEYYMKLRFVQKKIKAQENAAQQK